ncbi:hypothetical protein BDN70DRAFT_930448 [Pholiota conissans]|uniref:DUF6534 domain-containing protein n=1 Tax=Pholiota conissans TaxID=109636 RepID=A0A9P5Z5F3_9AGAR|nr:hypothetical protein BDN70DRAFT_930448 [Pholiota conissans]
MSSTLDTIDVTRVTAPLFVGIIFNWGLFGVLSIQVYTYFLSFPKDKPALKVLVGGVYILEATQIGLLTQTVWALMVNGFGNLLAFGNVGTTWISFSWIGSLVAVLVQCFYSYRIAIFAESRIIPGIIVTMSIISFAGSLTFSVLQKQAGTFLNFFENQSRSAAITLGFWIGTSTACDVLIAICMCYFLHKRKYGTFSRTQALLSKLIRMTIETGALTASISTLSLILYYLPSLKPWMYFEMPLSAEAKLYSTTLLAVLNSRAHIHIHSRMGSTSTDWREHDLVIPTSRLSRRGCTFDVSRSEIEFNTASSDSARDFQQTSIVVTKEQIVV